MLTLDGEAVYFFAGRVYLRRPGTIFLLDSGEERDLKSAPHKRDFTCFWLQLVDHETLTYHINHCDSSATHKRTNPSGMRKGQTVRDLHEAWDQALNQPDSALIRQRMRTTTAAMILSLWTAPDISDRKPQTDQTVEAVIQYIEQHAEKPLSLSKLAAYAGYSPFHFHRMFRQITGRTPAYFLTGERIRRACQLLAEHWTVEATAFAVGYESVAHFSRTFKQRTGTSPGGWRELQKGDVDAAVRSKTPAALQSRKGRGTSAIRATTTRIQSSNTSTGRRRSVQ